MAAFNPYHEWLGVPPEIQRPHYYQLLGVRPFEDNPTTIANAADRQMTYLRTLQSGSHVADSQRLLNEVAAARRCLLDAQKKAAYDTRLRTVLVVMPASNTPHGLPVVARLAPAQPAADAAASPGEQPVNEPSASDVAATEDFTAAEGHSSGRSAARARRNRGKPTGIKGPGVYSLVVLVVGVVGLAGVLWFRSQNWQIHLVQADPSGTTNPGPAVPGNGKKSDAKATSPAPAPAALVPANPAAPRGGEPQSGSAAAAVAQPSVSSAPKAVAGTGAAPPAGESQADNAVASVFIAPSPAASPDAATLPTEALEAGPAGEPAAADADGWVDLLDWAALVNWAPRGINWNAGCELPLTRHGITIKPLATNRFPLPAIIDGNYELEAEFTRLEGTEGITIFFPVGMHNMHLVLGENGGNTARVAFIDGNWDEPNPTIRRPCPVSTGQRHRVLIRVQQDGSQAGFDIDWDDAHDFISWQGPYSSLTNCAFRGWKVTTTRRPWIGASGSRVTFHKVRVRMTSGEIRPDFITAADRQRDLQQGLVRLIGLKANSPSAGWGRFLVNQIPFERFPSDEERLWPLVSPEFSFCRDAYAAHAPSRLKCPIPKGAKSFTAVAYNHSSRAVKYLVYIDGQEAFNSGLADIVPVRLALPPSSLLLELAVDPAGEKSFDHSYWCYPRFHAVPLAKVTDKMLDGKPGSLKFTIASSTVGFGELKYNEPIGESHALPIDFRDVAPCDEFLFAHPRSSVSYALPAGMTRFTAVGYSVRSQDVKFSVLADTRTVYESPAAGIVAINVKLPAGTKTIELRTEALQYPAMNYAMWCYPRLHRN